MTVVTTVGASVPSPNFRAEGLTRVLHHLWSNDVTVSNMVTHRLHHFGRFNQKEKRKALTSKIVKSEELIEKKKKNLFTAHVS